MVYSYKLVTLNMGEEHGIQLQVSYIKYGRRLRNMVYSYKLVTLNMGEHLHKYRLLVHTTLEIFLNSIKQPHLYRAMIRGLAEENLTIVLVLR